MALIGSDMNHDTVECCCPCGFTVLVCLWARLAVLASVECGLALGNHWKAQAELKAVQASVPMRAEGFYLKNLVCFPSAPQERKSTILPC